MASNVTAQSVLSKISEGHLECSICYNRYTEPKILDCLHTFCLKCLQNMRQHQDPILLCPLCRRKTTLFENGITGLPNNFALSALVEEVTMQEQLVEDQGSEIKCQACDENNQAVSICMDCMHFLCQECQRAHERMGIMKSHKMYTLAQLRSGEIVYRSKLRDDVPKCEVHPDQNLSIYCNTCEQSVCTTCSVLKHGSPEHSLVGLPEALDKCKQEIAAVAAEAERNKIQLIFAMNNINMSRKKLDTMFADTNKKISMKAEEEIAKIREEEWKLKREGRKIYQDRVKTFQTTQDINSNGVDQAEHKIDEANRLISEACCNEILNLKQKLLHNLRESAKIQSETLPDSLSFMDFTEGEKSLGKLVLNDELKTELKAKKKEAVRPGSLNLKEKWKLKAEIQSCGSAQSKLGGVYDVSAFSDNEMVMVDYWYQELISFIPKTRFKSHFNTQRVPLMKDLKYPSQVSVSKDDRLVVLDGPRVKAFNRKYQLLHQFVPRRAQHIRPTCLAVDDRNWIAVGYGGYEEISLHNLNGHLIRSLPAPMIDDYLTASKKRLFYTNFKNQKVLSVDYTGGKLFSVGIMSDVYGNWGPTGIFASDKGNLYVAIHGKPSGEIHCLSSDGMYLGLVIKECGSPHGITITTEGDLVVTSGESVKIYQRV